jgi:hypothetical protein
MKLTGEDKRLTDYLLGRLPEPDQVRLEEEYLADVTVQDRLLVAEDELVDSYLRGELSTEERTQLELRFLASPRGRRKLELARSLMLVSESAGRQTAWSSREPAAVVSANRFRVLAIRLTFACATLALVLLLVWSIGNRIRRGPENAEDQRDGIDRQAAPSSTAQSAKAPAQREKPPAQSQLPSIASVILKPTSRNVDQAPRVRISRNILRVRFELALDAGNHKTYQVALLGTGDDVKWSGHGFKPLESSSGKSVMLTLPATLFENGQYTLVLSPDEDGSSPIAEYNFVVKQE